MDEQSESNLYMTTKELTIPQGVELRDYQKDYLKTFLKEYRRPGGKRRWGVCWHRQAGKDFTSFITLAIAAATRPGIYWYVLPTKGQAYDIVAEGFDHNGNNWMDCIPKEMVLKTPARGNPNIYFSNGSIIRFRGSDKVKGNNRGQGPVGVVMSEYAFCEFPEIIKIIDPILNSNDGFMIVNSTPNGRNHFYDLLESGRKNPDVWQIDVRSLADTKRFSWEDKVQPQIDSGEISLEWALQEYMCSFGELNTGSIYGNEIQKTRDEGRVGPFDYDPDREVDTYWDIGIKDYTAVWFCQNIGSRRVLIDYYEDNRKPPSEYVKMLKDKKYRYNKHYLPHDAGHSKPSTYELLTTQGMYDRLLKDFNVTGKTVLCDKPHKKIVAINNLRSIFHTLYFSENVRSALNNVEKARFKFDGKANSFSPEPQKSQYLHGTDALTLIGVASAMRNKEYFLEGGNKRASKKAKTGLSIKW